MSLITDNIYDGRDLILEQFRSGKKVINIAGGSCSGKTELIKSLEKKLKNKLVVLPLDSYYKDGNKDTNFDEPDALDLGLAYKHLNDLLEGKTIQKPIYNFETHSREGSEIVYPNEFILIEGLFALFPQFKKRSSYNVFTDVNIYVALDRRIKRDVIERGRDEKSVIKQFFETVLPMYQEHVQDQKNYANLIIDNSIYRKEFSINKAKST